jgi:phenylpyruvate tautomerase PptA (4-oxalocrotonate tautomerase family)
MPIIDVEVVEQPGSSLLTNLSNELAVRIGDVLHAKPGTVWVKLHRIPFVDYAESDGNPDALAPVFVNVLMATLPEGEAFEAAVVALTQAVAELCDRSRDNVHVLFAPSARGRQAFGGKLVR